MTTTWTPVSQANKGLIPDHYMPWLEKPYILSKALKSISKTFSVQLISQSLGVLTADEKTILDAKDPFSYVRQGYLMCDEKAYVYTRVCIPYKTLYINKEAFENLGSRPIGETLLYNNPNTTRGEFEVNSFSSDSTLFKDTYFYKKNVPEIWGRRSLFHMNDNPLLISEFFLSSIPSYLEVYDAQLKEQLAILSKEAGDAENEKNTLEVKNS